MTLLTNRSGKVGLATGRATLALFLFALPANANLILSWEHTLAEPSPQVIVFIGVVVVLVIGTYAGVQHAACRRRRRELWFAAERQICS